MRKKDVDTFIEEMEAIGDEWTPEQVEDVYGDSSLEEALDDRKATIGTSFDIIGKVINRDEGREHYGILYRLWSGNEVYWTRRM